MDLKRRQCPVLDACAQALTKRRTCAATKACHTLTPYQSDLVVLLVVGRASSFCHPCNQDMVTALASLCCSALCSGHRRVKVTVLSYCSKLLAARSHVQHRRRCFRLEAPFQEAPLLNKIARFTSAMCAPECLQKAWIEASNTRKSIIAHCTNAPNVRQMRVIEASAQAPLRDRAPSHINYTYNVL